MTSPTTCPECFPVTLGDYMRASPQLQRHIRDNMARRREPVERDNVVPFPQRGFVQVEDGL